MYDDIRYRACIRIHFFYSFHFAFLLCFLFQAWGAQMEFMCIASTEGPSYFWLWHYISVYNQKVNPLKISKLYYINRTIQNSLPLHHRAILSRRKRKYFLLSNQPIKYMYIGQRFAYNRMIRKLRYFTLPAFCDFYELYCKCNLQK